MIDGEYIERPAKIVQSMSQENQLGRFMIASRVGVQTLMHRGQGFSMDAAGV